MEILIEVVIELFLGVVSVAIGFAVGSVIFLLVRTGRRSLRRLDPPAPVADPEGRQGMRPWRLSGSTMSMPRLPRRQQAPPGPW